MLSTLGRMAKDSCLFFSPQTKFLVTQVMAILRVSLYGYFGTFTKLFLATLATFRAMMDDYYRFAGGALTQSFRMVLKVGNGMRDCLALTLAIMQVVAGTALKPVLTVALGSTVVVFLASLAIIESVFNFRGMLDDVLAAILSLGLATLDVLEKTCNVRGILDDVLFTVRAMFDDYLRYKEHKRARRCGGTSPSSSARQKNQEDDDERENTDILTPERLSSEEGREH